MIYFIFLFLILKMHGSEWKTGGEQRPSKISRHCFSLAESSGLC